MSECVVGNLTILTDTPCQKVLATFLKCSEGVLRDKGRREGVKESVRE